MNMFKPTKAKDREEYINSLEPGRKAAILELDKFIQKTIPDQKPNFAANMLGYGEFDYTNSKKQTGKWPLIALASQKNYISLYICSIKNGKYLAENFKDQLGRVSVGKSCVRFKSLDDLKLPILKKLLIEATKNPGFEQN